MHTPRGWVYAFTCVLLASSLPAAAPSARARVELRQLRRVVRATGVVQPIQAVSVPVPRVPEAGNLVLARIVASGTMVQPGDIVAEFDRTTLLDKRREAQAKFEDLSHQVEQRKAQHRADAEKRANDLQLAQADLAKARLELRRGRLLSEIERLKAESKLEDALAHVASLQKSMKLRDATAAADLKILELQRDRQKISMDRAASNADKLQLRATLAGMVAQEVVWRSGGPGHPQEGDQLWGGQPLLRIFASTKMEVQVSVAEPDGAALVAGSRAKVYLDAYPKLVFDAMFDSASPVAASSFDATQRTFAARYLIEGTDPRLLPDLSAAVEIESATEKPVLSLPREAVRHLRGRSYVTRVTGEGKHEEQEVTLGAFDDAYVEIVSGLRAGDVVQAAARLDQAAK